MDNLVATISEIANTKVGYDIAFPNLGIFITNLRNTITIGNFTIAYYGIIIALGMLISFTVVSYKEKKRMSLLRHPFINPYETNQISYICAF